MDQKFNLKTQYRQFGFTLAVLIALIFGLLFPWWFEHEFSIVPWVISLVFVLLSAVFPMSLGLIYKPWMVLGHLLGWVNTRLILGVVFFFLFAPIGLFLRLFRKDLLDQKFDQRALSSWKKSTKRSPKHMKEIY